ncbi:unnamed protein product [Pelagomonas calceolata]|uniref:Replication protein A C-terminal domain-containing protein n=1 Tax=Pelagomonas calceolata TaxID=35677 RepID=A0A8J2SFX1_9STRA|nr:unnamed protein product [Pelagomonas calceolata]|mmetsp:Transcript_18033/g.51447  ORF Transcript_18033/g.51447 Transcript_18033/m.51447 type:complete len:212 (-) Transcript_18033:58-693(-)
MAARRALLDLLERAVQLLREGTTPGCTNLTKPELRELAATARALAAGAEAEIEVTTLQQRVLNYYTIHGTSYEGCNMNDVAASLGIDLAKVRSAVDFLEDEGELYSTIDEDHHKFTMEEEELAAAAQLPLREEKKDVSRCVVCMDATANMSFVHGNTAHLATCEACAKKFKRHNQLGASGAVSRISSPPATSIADRCPVCRQGIERIAKQF